MSDKILQMTSMTFYGLGFPSQDFTLGRLKPLFAVFYYPHHGGHIEEINAELATRKLRPMSYKELREFFAIHQLSLTKHSCPLMLAATAPDGIKADDDGSNRFLVPGIWIDEDGVKCGYLRVDNLGGKAYLADHSYMVLAIDESKTC